MALMRKRRNAEETQTEREERLRKHRDQMASSRKRARAEESPTEKEARLKREGIRE